MIVDTTRCNHCGSFVSRDIRFSDDGTPFWVCSMCGVVTEDHRWYKYVDQKEATEIIEHRGRRGRFVQEDGATYIGIDNTTGDAWVEEFPDLLECLMWLAGNDKENAVEAEPQKQYETGGGPEDDVELRQYRCLRCGHVWYEDCDAPDYPDYCPGCGESI